MYPYARSCPIKVHDVIKQREDVKINPVMDCHHTNMVQEENPCEDPVSVGSYDDCKQTILN